MTKVRSKQIRLTVICAVLIAILFLAENKSNAMGLVVSYRGAQDKYYPCIIVTDETTNRSTLSQIIGKLGCNGLNITAQIKSKNLKDAIAQVMTASSSKEEAPILFIMLDGAKQKRMMFDIPQGVEVLRKLLIHVPQIQTDVENRFIRRLIGKQRISKE